MGSEDELAVSPPAFQFYASDFIGGVMAFSSEQVGAYVLLLCYQWMNGSIPSDDMELCHIGRCSSTALAVVKRKFKISLPDGTLQNARLESIRESQMEYRRKQAENGQKGGLAAKHRSSTAQAPLLASVEQRSSTPTPTPISLEREPNFPECNGAPNLEEVRAKAEMIGLADWKACDWFAEMQGCGWLDHAHRPVRDWAAILGRVRTKWESDGRPNSPPKQKGSVGEHKSIEASKQLTAIERRYESFRK